MGTWERGNGTPTGQAAEQGVRRFEDLQVWQTARELTAGIYRACKTQPLGSDRSLASQMKRAAVSIGSNIAEGYERGTRKQQIEYCYYAKGSAGEPRSQVIATHDVGLLNDEAYGWLAEKCDKCSRQIAAYVSYLQRSQSRIAGMKHPRRKPAEAAPGDEDAAAPTVPTLPPSHVPTRRADERRTR